MGHIFSCLCFHTWRRHSRRFKVMSRLVLRMVRMWPVTIANLLMIGLMTMTILWVYTYIYIYINIPDPLTIETEGFVSWPFIKMNLKYYLTTKWWKRGCAAKAFFNVKHLRLLSKCWRISRGWSCSWRICLPSSCCCSSNRAASVSCGDRQSISEMQQFPETRLGSQWWYLFYSIFTSAGWKWKWWNLHTCVVHCQVDAYFQNSNPATSHKPLLVDCCITCGCIKHYKWKDKRWIYPPPRNSHQQDYYHGNLSYPPP